jgi:multicomponent Na+:H+ antiporter subunit E
MSAASALRRVGRVAALVAHFSRALVAANVDMIMAVLRPHRTSRSVVAVELGTDKRWLIVVYANMISLMPGTMSLDTTPDNRKLYVFVLHRGPLAKARADLDALQRSVLGALA